MTNAQVAALAGAQGGKWDPVAICERAEVIKTWLDAKDCEGDLPAPPRVRPRRA